MFGKIYKNWIARDRRRRKRALEEIRGQFERDGYSLEDLTDSEVEQAITSYGDPIENSKPLTGREVYWVLRRLSPDGERFRARRIAENTGITANAINEQKGD
jgi:hypothetical protein